MTIPRVWWLRMEDIFETRVTQVTWQLFTRKVLFQSIFVKIERTLAHFISNFCVRTCVTYWHSIKIKLHSVLHIHRMQICGHLHSYRHVDVWNRKRRPTNFEWTLDHFMSNFIKSICYCFSFFNKWIVFEICVIAKIYFYPSTFISGWYQSGWRCSMWYVL